MVVPQIIHFNRVFHYKPSILKYHYFRKPPYINQELESPTQHCDEMVLVIFLGTAPHAGFQSPPGWHSIFRIGNPELNLNLCDDCILGFGGFRPKMFPKKHGKQWLFRRVFFSYFKLQTATSEVWHFLLNNRQLPQRSFHTQLPTFINQLFCPTQKNTFPINPNTR